MLFCSGESAGIEVGPWRGGFSTRVGPGGDATEVWRRAAGDGGVPSFIMATDGRTLSRPSWALDNAVWVVVDGNSVVRVIREAGLSPAG